MTILIDDRAGSIDLLSIEPLNSPDLCIPCRLDSGDISFIGNGPNGPVNVGIEFKSLSDLISSLQSSRLQSQIKRMVNEYDEKWILYYGVYRPGIDSNKPLQEYRPGNPKRRAGWYDYKPGGSKGVTYGYLESFLLSPSLTGLGFHVKHVANVEEAALWIHLLYKSWSKPWAEHRSMRVADRGVLDQQVKGKVKNANKKQVLFYTASQLPEIDKDTKAIMDVALGLTGLGYEKALAVGKYFDSVIEMINADEKEWAEIKIESSNGSGRVMRLGPVIAKAVVGRIRAVKSRADRADRAERAERKTKLPNLIDDSDLIFEDI